MKLHHSIAIAFATYAICVTLCSALDEPEGKKVLETARSRFVLPNIFDYAQFKQIFRKSYQSVVEDVARKKMFIARAFKVFVAAVKYKYRKSSVYLSINQMSDWTPAEVDQIYLRPEHLAAHFDAPNRQSAAFPAAEVEEVEKALAEIAEHPDAEPGFREIAAELSRGEESKRRRRSAAGGERDLSPDQLTGKPEAAIKLGEQVESNNPNYEQPELTSYGSEDPGIRFSIPLDLASFVNAAKGNDYLNSILKSAVNLFNPDADKAVEKAEIDKFFDAKSSEQHTYFEDDEEEERELADEVFVDHRESGCLFTPRDQGYCGSCYVFAAIALYEWHYCQATRKIVAFSEQYVVDCGKLSKMNGCNGGSVTFMPYFVNDYGLELRLNYPYRVKEDQCPYEEGTPAHKMGYLRVQDSGYQDVPLAIVDHFLAKSPLVVNIFCYEGFSEYGGGVANPTNCDPNRAHSVLIVGSGREDGEEYWLMRNSHSVAFGEEGHYKLNKKATSCIAENRAFKLSNFKIPKTKAKDVAPEVRKRYHDYMVKEVRDSKNSDDFLQRTLKKFKIARD